VIDTASVECLPEPLTPTIKPMVRVLSGHARAMDSGLSVGAKRRCISPSSPLSCYDWASAD
jgi:hypothetical protein